MKDLTKGYPAKVIMMFAVPLMISSIFQQLYNMVDSMIVSTCVGTDALAAVGATSVVSNTLIGFIHGLSQGFAILIANSFGAKDMKRMRRFIAGTIVLTIAVTIVVTVAGFTSIASILEFLNTPEDILPDALSYVRIILAGTMFSTIYNMCASVLGAVGDSKRPLYCLVAGVITNIALDLLFVRAFGLGIKGAAYATIISQALTALLCGGYLVWKLREILPKGDEWKLEEGQYSNLIASGLSMGLMGCIVNVGTIVLQGSINDLGTDIIAAHTAARRILDILMVMVYIEGVAMTTYVSQNMGAGLVHRVKQGVRHANLIVTAITTFLIVICYLFAEPALKWITHTENGPIIEAGTMYLQVSVLFFYVLGPLFVLRCSLQGMGRKVVPVIASVLEMVVKVLSANLLVPVFGYVGVAFTEPVSWIIMTTWLTIGYLAKTPDKMFAK